MPISKTVLLGDFGAAKFGEDDISLWLKDFVAKSNPLDSILFLGDNLYPYGLPPESHQFRKEFEAKFTQMLQIFEGFKGKLQFISGNHDWNKGKENGLEYVLSQEAFLQKYFNRNDILLPKGGCPGPALVELHANLSAIFINTQWWVQKGAKPIGAKNGCLIESEADFFSVLSGLIESQKGKRILLVSHHPILSNAEHGGYFAPSQHLFPLRELNKNLWLPLPGAGSLFPLFRRYIGTREDITHRTYKPYLKGQKRIMDAHEGLIFVSAHDHNLQYFNYHKSHMIVSGAGSKSAFVKTGGKASFTKSEKGFFVLEQADLKVNCKAIWFENGKQHSWETFI